MAATIVYVHGNGNKVREALLKAQWDEALAGRDLGDRSRMAYWAPLRYPAPLPDPAFDGLEQLPVPPLDAPPPAESTAAFVAGVEAEAQAEAAAGPEVAPVADPLHGWLERMSYAADALAEGEAAAPPSTSTLEALPFPRAVRTAAFRAFVRQAFKDVHAYFFGGHGDAMRGVVRRALDGVEGPVVVLSHSLGTIIAYDVLRERSRDVPLLLTVGSPLGVTEVQDLITRPLEVPAGVAAWRNVSDARDLVALDHTLRPAYAPADACTDFLVTNDSANHHGIREYLLTAPIRRPVLELLDGAPVT